MPTPFGPKKPFLLFTQNSPKMAQILSILLLFLATFTPKATAEKPGPLTVTVDPEYIPFSTVRRFNVYLAQASKDNESEDCDNPTVSLTKTSPIEFTLDWNKCPRAVEHPKQLRQMRIEIDVLYKGDGGQQRMNINLENYSADFYHQIYAGGKARLVGGESKGSPKLEPEHPTGTPGTSSQSHQLANASSGSHGHAIQVVPNGKPRTLTVTVDPEYISNVRHFNVLLLQSTKEDGFHFDDCESSKVSLTHSIEFTVDWSKCPRAVKRPEQLRHLQIQIEFLKGYGHNRMLRIWLKKYSAGFYRRIFAGGKAKLLKFLKTVDDELKEFPKLVYVEDPNGTFIPPAGTLTFNVEYQHRTISSIRRAEVKHASNSDVEMGECLPENVMGGKFALDLAKCNVYDMGDFLDLKMQLRVALQKGQYPNRVEGRKEWVDFKTLAGQPENVLHQLYSAAHQMNILLSEKYKPMISLNGQYWANAQTTGSAGTSNHPQHSSASSSHANALQLIPKSNEELTAQVASAGYYMGRKLASSIAFWVPREILKVRRAVMRAGRYVVVELREIHLVNDEQHKMRLFHADGDECPVNIAGDFDGISAVLRIDWTKCTPNPLKSHEELEGMELVVYYRLDQDEPKQIRHTFKQDEPLQNFFDATTAGCLKLFEDGSVKFMLNA